jgi:hypothetical protein
VAVLQVCGVALSPGCCSLRQIRSIGSSGHDVTSLRYRASASL